MWQFHLQKKNQNWQNLLNCYGLIYLQLGWEQSTPVTISNSSGVFSRLPSQSWLCCSLFSIPHPWDCLSFYLPWPMLQKWGFPSRVSEHTPCLSVNFAICCQSRNRKQERQGRAYPLVWLWTMAPAKDPSLMHPGTATRPVVPKWPTLSSAIIEIFVKIVIYNLPIDQFNSHQTHVAVVSRK